MRTLILTLLPLLVLAMQAIPASAQISPPSAFGGTPTSPSSPPPAFGPATPSKPATPPSAFGGAGPAPSGSSAIIPQAAPIQAHGLFGAILSWVVDTQQRWQRSLADGVRNLRNGNPLVAALTLAGLSFAYGVLHAIGPGHGKTIISAYVTANEEAARRGILICILAAIVQAMSAVILVAVLAILLNATGLTLKAWSEKLETVSYGFIALVGIWLFVRQVLKLLPHRTALAAHSVSAAASPEAAHDHDHHHDHACHTHEHGHDCEGCGCGHSHMPDLDRLEKPLKLREMAAVIFSVGIRPCSGAIVVLVFALIQGLFWAGVAATFAMALGTAVTVAAIAIFTLSFREVALQLGGRQGVWAKGVWTACGLGGAVVITLFGSLLFIASLGPARPF